MYKLTMFIWEDSKTLSDARARKYITVASGLTWQEAKTKRAENRALQIVHEYPKHLDYVMPQTFAAQPVREMELAT